MQILRVMAGLAPAVLLAALLAAPLAASPPAGAAAAGTRVFDVSVGGIRAGELVLSAGRDGARYRAGSTIRATGILGTLTRLRYEGTSTGTIGPDGAILPARHTARSRAGRTDRTTDMVFENGSPASISIEPPRSRRPDPAAHAGTVDPVSAAVAILMETRPETLCNRRHQLFDGHRRSEILVGRAEARDGRLVCNGRYARVFGDSLPTTDENEWGFRLFFRPLGEGVELERIETPTRYGLAVVTPRR